MLGSNICKICKEIKKVYQLQIIRRIESSSKIYKPLEEFVEGNSVRETILPDSDGFQNAGVTQLLHDLLFVEEFRAP